MAVNDPTDHQMIDDVRLVLLAQRNGQALNPRFSLCDPGTNPPGHQRALRSWGRSGGTAGHAGFLGSIGGQRGPSGTGRLGGHPCGRRALGRPICQSVVGRGRQEPGDRYPHRAVRGAASHSPANRRHAVRDPHTGRDDGLLRQHRLANQGDGAVGHRGKAAAPGWSNQSADRRRRNTTCESRFCRALTERPSISASSPSTCDY